MPKGVRRSVSINHVISFLDGLDFPTSKADIVEHVEEREAPDEVIDFFEELPDQDYHSSEQVIERCRRMIVSVYGGKR